VRSEVPRQFFSRRPSPPGYRARAERGLPHPPRYPVERGSTACRDLTTTRPGGVVIGGAQPSPASGANACLGRDRLALHRVRHRCRSWDRGWFNRADRLRRRQPHRGHRRVCCDLAIHRSTAGLRDGRTPGAATHRRKLLRARRVHRGGGDPHSRRRRSPRDKLGWHRPCRCHGADDAAPRACQAPGW
jgi:hypothetical protein